MIRSVGIFSSKDEPVGIFSLWILTQVSLNFPTAYMILRIPARGYCTECISWNFYTLNSKLGYFEYSNYHRSQLKYSNCLYNIKLSIRVYCTNGPVGILSIKIRTEVTWNILNPAEASLNIPTAYITLSCQSDLLYKIDQLEFSVSGF